MPVTITAIAGGTQAALSLVQGLTADAQSKKYLGLRKAYKTPEQIFKILQSIEGTQGGFDPKTLQYLTGQTDQALGTSINAATLLGGDPNQLSNIFWQKVQSDMKVGHENHLENLKNFDKYISALGLVADNLAAEQKSQQDLIKDRLQKYGYDKQASTAGFGSGLNALLASLSVGSSNKLYTQSSDVLSGG